MSGRSALSCGCDPGANYTCEGHAQLGAWVNSDEFDLSTTPAVEAVQDFVVKDSGDRMAFDSGMVRDVTTDKTDYLLVRDGPMYERWADHLTKGAVKYDKRNWMLADKLEETERFRESAARHFEQWLRGDMDEDHAAAVFFNINGAEYVEGR